MKKTRFTLVELVLVVAVVAVFAIIFSGCGAVRAARERANNKACISNLKQMGNIATMYTNDNRSVWANSPSYSYAWSMVRGKYFPDRMEDRSACCPSIKRDPDQRGSIRTFDQSNIQMYAAVADNRAGSDDFGVIQLNGIGLSNGADRIGGKVTAEGVVGPGKRLWICDGLRPDTQRQRTLLTTWRGGANNCARPYAVHDGRVNIVAVDGHVSSVGADELKNYYVPYFPSADPREAYGVRVGMYMERVSSRKPAQLVEL